ncbi:MAG: hypothetical protein AAF368_13830, partial [Planctomycetota bacterium]
MKLNAIGPGGSEVDDFVVDLTRIDTPSPVSARLTRSRSMLKDGRIFGLVPGDYTVRVSAGTMSGEVTVMGLAEAEERVRTVVIRPELGVHGYVQRPDGTEAPGVLVRLLRRAEVNDSIDSFVLSPSQVHVQHPERYRSLIAQVVTDETGRFEFQREAEDNTVVVAGDP